MFSMPSEPIAFWTAMQAIGQIAGAVLVFVSLIYLSAQIRQSTRAMRAESARAAVAAVRDFNESMVENPAVTRIFRVGAEGLSHLSLEERAQFAHLALNFFKTAEDLHYQFTRGTLDPDVWESWRTLIAVYAKSPGFQEYWLSRRTFFTPTFQKECDSWPPPEVPRVAQFVSRPDGQGAEAVGVGAPAATGAETEGANCPEVAGAPAAASATSAGAEG